MDAAAAAAVPDEKFVTILRCRGLNLRGWWALMNEAKALNYTAEKMRSEPYPMDLLANAQANAKEPEAAIAYMERVSPLLHTRGTTIPWENVMLEQCGFFCNATQFPVVISKAALPYRYGGMYTVFYSSVPLQGVVSSANDYVRVKLVKDKGVHQEGKRQVTVSVHYKYLGDLSAEAAVIAALNNSDPMHDSFITFIPAMTPEDVTVMNQVMMERPGTYPDIRGASLGMAVMMCVLGAPSIAYTGYVRHWGPDTEINRWANNPNHPELHRTQTMAAPATVRVIRALNFVENVQDIGVKCLVALKNIIPLVFPYSTQFDTPIIDIFKGRYFAQHSLQLRMAAYAYTTAMKDDGVNYIKYKSPLMVGSCVEEFLTLSALAGAYFVANSLKTYSDQIVAFEQKQMYNQQSGAQALDASIAHHTQKVQKYVANRGKKKPTPAQVRANALERLRRSVELKTRQIAAARDQREKRIMQPLPPLPKDERGGYRERALAGEFGGPHAVIFGHIADKRSMNASALAHQLTKTRLPNGEPAKMWQVVLMNRGVAAPFTGWDAEKAVRAYINDFQPGVGGQKTAAPAVPIATDAAAVPTVDLSEEEVPGAGEEYHTELEGMYTQPHDTPVEGYETQQLEPQGGVKHKPGKVRTGVASSKRAKTATGAKVSEREGTAATAGKAPVPKAKPGGRQPRAATVTIEEPELEL